MNSRLFKKFFLTTSIIFIAGLTFLSTILGLFVVNYLVNDIEGELSENCTAVSDVFLHENFSSEMLPGMIAAVSDASDSDIYITDVDGNVVMCGCDEWKESNMCNISDHTVSSDVLSRVRKGTFFDGSTMNGFYGKTPHYTSGVLLRDTNEKEVGFVFCTTPTSKTMSFFTTLIRMYLVSAIIPITLMFFAEYALSYRLTKPLRQMSDAAKRMAKGDFSRRIPVVSDDEIGDLSISFNNMTNSLVQLESMRRSFIANVSHELRTPMTTIGGFIDGILDGTIDKERQDHYLKIVSDEVKRLTRLVESMLCLAKLESGEQEINPQRFDIVKITRSIVVSQEKRITEKNISIEGLEGDSVVLCADYDLIYQVIFNLVDNAIKFTQHSGKIVFVIEKIGDTVGFCVKNTGSFISKEELVNIFERFYKADKSRSANKEGTGLGLYISKTIIDIHSGKIFADSKEGKFTEFSFTVADFKG